MLAAKKKKKRKKKSVRNPFALPAKLRKAGPHRNKKDKRAEENKNPDLTDENL